LSLKFKLIRFGIELAIIFIIFVVIFSFTSVEFTGFLLFAFLIIALMATGILEGYKRGLFHQGHFPILFGLVAMIGAGILIVGTFEFSYMTEEGVIEKKEKLYDFTPIETGVFIFVMAFGYVSLHGGVKQALNNQWQWGWKRQW